MGVAVGDGGVYVPEVSSGVKACVGGIYLLRSEKTV